jgi:hypothetical protein
MTRGAASSLISPRRGPDINSQASHLKPERHHSMSTVLWLILAVVYIALFVTLALRTLRKGHLLLFWVGIIFPVLWIIGAVIAPTRRAEARGVA